jgi:Xaa-Pro aminopeptidase
MTPNARITKQLPELKLDALIVSALPNIRYLCGFTGSNGLLVLSAESATLFTDPRYSIRAAGESSAKVEIAKGSLFAAALKLIAKKRWKRLGFEANRIPYGNYAELEKDLPSKASLHPVNGLVEHQRMVKTDEEVSWIRESVLTNSKAFDSAVRQLKPSMTEMDLAAELEYQMRRNGAEKPAFETIVAAGPHSALPHAQPSAEVLGSNRLLLIDMGAMQAGYASDMTRMVHLGKPGQKARKLYKAVLEAQLAGISAVRENTTAGAVDRSTRQVLKAYGYDEYFVHSTGHGLGLEIHESPRVGKKDKTVLKAGMVITIEPGAYIEGFGGIRIEDTVLVTKTGCEVLTPTGKELIVT